MLSSAPKIPCLEMTESVSRDIFILSMDFSTDSNPNAMLSLPEEIITDILSRLPVRLLLRFRCISMHWRALIDSSDFVKLHLNRSIETNTTLSFIIKLFF
ncbi:hypothetical protein ACSBR2_037484 [Camellia fascicularis]